MMALNLSGDKLENARTIIRVGREMGMSDAVIIMALSVAKSESGLYNNPGGDRDSAGLFQQRPSQGWGTYAQVTNPEYAARKFYEAALGTIRTHPNTPMAEIAWRTQRPATEYRGMYATNMDFAFQLFGQEQASPGARGSGEIGTADGGAGFGGATPAPQGPTERATGGTVGLGADGQLAVALASNRTITADSSDEEIDTYVREKYPQLAGLWKIPEVREILMRAAREEMDEYELGAILGQSTWWKNTPPDTRQWLALAGSDPAAAEQRISDVEGQLTTKWRALGGFEGPSATWLIRVLAQDSMVLGLNPEELDQRLVDLIRAGDPNTPVRDLAQGDGQDAAAIASGDRAQVSARVKAIFDNAGIVIGTAQESDAARIDRITNEILNGARTFDDVRVSVDAQKPATGPGLISASADKLGAMAREYLVPIDKNTLDDWAFRIAQGNATEQGFQSYVTGLSKGRFAGDQTITAFIESGGTPSQYFGSHRAMVANILELSPDQIDLMDPKWMELTEQVQSDGTRRAPTLAEASKWARHQPGFENTRAANDVGARYTDQILRTMGAIR